MGFHVNLGEHAWTPNPKSPKYPDMGYTSFLYILGMVTTVLEIDPVFGYLHPSGKWELGVLALFGVLT